MTEDQLAQLTGPWPDLVLGHVRTLQEENSRLKMLLATVKPDSGWYDALDRASIRIADLEQQLATARREALEEIHEFIERLESGYGETSSSFERGVLTGLADAQLAIRKLMEESPRPRLDADKVRREVAKRCCEIAQETIDALDGPETEFEFPCDIYQPIQRAISSEFGLEPDAAKEAK